MSGETTPIMSGAIPAFESFMTKWEKLGKGNLSLSPMVNAGLKSAYKYYNRMDHTKAYVVAMCKQTDSIKPAKTNILSAVINPARRFGWIKKHWGENFIERAENTIQQLVSLLV